MKLVEKLVHLFLRFYPIKTVSPYRFVPLFFVVGGCIEWIMIKFPGAGAGETFYDVLRRNQSQRLYEARLAEEKFLTSLKSESDGGKSNIPDQTT